MATESRKGRARKPGFTTRTQGSQGPAEAPLLHWHESTGTPTRGAWGGRREGLNTRVPTRTRIRPTWD